jgi:hypothetical protein
MHAPRKTRETDVKSNAHGESESLPYRSVMRAPRLPRSALFATPQFATLIATLSGLIASAALLTSPHHPRASLNVPECYALEYSGPIGRVAGEWVFQGSPNPAEEAQHGQFIMDVRTDCAAPSRAGQRGAAPRTLR